MTHICVGKLTIIGEDNGLSPGWCQAIILTNAGILLIGPLGTNFSEIIITILTFSFKEMHLKMSFGNWRPFCLGLNVLILSAFLTSWHSSINISYCLCGWHPPTWMDNLLCKGFLVWRRWFCYQYHFSMHMMYFCWWLGNHCIYESGHGGGLVLLPGFHDDVIKWKHFPRYWPLCGELTGPAEFPAQRPVTRSFDVFFDLLLE